MNKDVVRINQPGELIKWLSQHDNDLMLSEQEADLLLGYIEGHDYQLATQGDKLYRVDLQETEGKEELVDYPIEDVVDIVCEWNYEMIQCADEERNKAVDEQDSIEAESRYEKLLEDEEQLDCIFDRTRYGQDLNNLAVLLAEEAIRHIREEGGIEKAATTITQGMAQLQGRAR